LHPTQIISYYPTYALLDQVITNGYKNLNIFIDIKNCAQTLFQKHCIEALIENSKMTKYIDTSIFQSVLSYLTFHKLYATKRKININFYLFLEMGTSYYHYNLSSRYKIGRKIDDLYGLDHESKETFFSIVKNNWLLIDKVFNRIPNINVIRLENLEADFIPYYFIKNGLVETSTETANMIYSNDHDLKQSLINPNCYIFSKAAKVKRIIRCGEVMSTEIKVENSIPDQFLPLKLSLVGDAGDDVIGIKGFGPKTFLKKFNLISELFGGDMNEVYRKVFNNEPLFNIKSEDCKDKIIKKIVEFEENGKCISINLGLTSFELLSMNVNNPKTTEMMDKKEQIMKSLKHQKLKKDPILKALELNQVFIETDEFDVLYFGSDLYDPDRQKEYY
jgi:hypothetical protein